MRVTTDLSDAATRRCQETNTARYLNGTLWHDVHYAIAKIVELGIDTTNFPERREWESMSMASSLAFMFVKAARDDDRPSIDSLDGSRHRAYDYALSLVDSDRNLTNLC